MIETEALNNSVQDESVNPTTENSIENEQSNTEELDNSLNKTVTGEPASKQFKILKNNDENSGAEKRVSKSSLKENSESLKKTRTAGWYNVDLAYVMVFLAFIAYLAYSKFFCCSDKIQDL